MCSARRWIRLSSRWDSGSRWPEFSPSDSPLVVKGAERASEDAAAEDERERRSGGELESLGLMLLRRRPTSRSELTRPMSRPKPPLSVEVIGLRAPLALVLRRSRRSQGELFIGPELEHEAEARDRVEGRQLLFAHEHVEVSPIEVPPLAPLPRRSLPGDVRGTAATRAGDTRRRHAAGTHTSAPPDTLVSVLNTPKPHQSSSFGGGGPQG